MSEFEPLSLSPKAAAALLMISRSKLYVLLGNGTLTARKDGGRTLIDYATVKAHHEHRPAFVPGIAMPNAPHIQRPKRRTASHG
jgi:excisionase family DNA binding protein